MLSTVGGMEVGIVKIGAVSNRGFTPEEIAEQALDKIISIGNNSHPVIQAQAEAFRKETYTDTNHICMVYPLNVLFPLHHELMV